MKLVSPCLSVFSVVSIFVVGFLLVPLPTLAQERVTFTRDVAPILFSQCVPCHRPNGPAPFPLLTYMDAKRRAEQIALVTKNRTMPPWKADSGKPDSGHQEYLDRRVLTEKQIATLQTWAESGAAEGDKNGLPPSPRFRDDWRLGKPDLVVTMPKPYTLNSDTQHIYRSFVIPLPNVGPKWLRGIEFRPSNPQVVRQATLFLDTSGAARQREAQSGGAGYADFNSGLGNSVNSVCDWTTGVTPRLLPDGVAVRVERNADLVLQLRFRPTGKPETEQSQIGLYFAKSPPRGVPSTIHLGAGEYYLQPGKTSVMTDSLTLPVPVRALSIVPNLHAIGTLAKVTAKLPDGAERILLSISDWDSEWRRPYGFAKPLSLPAGTTLTMELRFDNTTKNPRNPKPEIVRANLRHLEDMASLWITVVSEQAIDRRKLEGAISHPGRQPRVVETGTYLRDPSQRPSPRR